MKPCFLIKPFIKINYSNLRLTLQNQKNISLKITRTLALTLILSLLLIPAGSFAQRHGDVLNNPNYDQAPYHFGFILAVNQMNFTVKTKPDLSNTFYSGTSIIDLNGDSARLLSVDAKPSLGFTIGIVSNLRLGNSFDLRFIPSLSFGQRNLHYSISIDTNSRTTSINKDIQSTFIDLPLMVKYKGKRIGNVRPYLIAGVKYSIDLGTQKKKKDSEENIRVDLVRDDTYAELGAGFDFYNYWFKFGTEIKMSYGLSNILKKDKSIYTQGIDKLTSKIFQLTFTFE